ncbi:hypothetical protein UlMin_007991 [Ulmus minor]
MKAGREYRKGLWTTEEDRILMDYINVHGKGKWNRIAKETGLKRGGKSCRLRWINYLSPSVKRGDFSEEEEDLIIRLHNLLGNRWSLIAGRVPGRTDNQVKNHWNTHLSKKLKVKKGKNKTMDSSEERVEETLDVPSRSNLSDDQLPTLSNGEAAGDKEITKDVCDQSAALGFTQEGNVRDNYETPFWFFNDVDLINLNFLVESPNNFSHDFVWHGL